MRIKINRNFINYYNVPVFCLIFVFILPFLVKILGLSWVDYKNFYAFLNAGNTKQEYFHSFLFTVYFMTITVVGQVFLAMITAYLAYFSVNSAKYLILFFIPYTFPLFISTLSIRMGFDTNGYLTNIINLNMNSGYLFYPLSDDIFSYFLLIVLGIWQYFPFAFFIIYTMMKRINNKFIDMAIIDGASDFKLFTKILMPNMKFVIFPLIMLRLLFMFNKYDLMVLFSKSVNPPIKLLNLFPLLLRNHFNSNSLDDIGFILVIFILLFFLILSLLLKTILNIILKRI